MKFLHWIIFSVASWLVFAPFVGDDILALFLGSEDISTEQFLLLIRWDDFFLGLTIMVLALIVINGEQASHKQPGLRAMHWMQVLLGAFLAMAPFIFPFDIVSFKWSHVVFGGFVAIFALLQIRYESRR